ncbi:MAG TPA: hypothetical protein VFQ02_08220 [Nitrospira sp.]|nr:hypothetical protein [Nitrospira sp.]
MSNVSSSTPAEIRALLDADFDWFMVLDSAGGVLDIVGLDVVGLDIVGLDVVGLEVVAAPPAPGELSWDSIVLSLAQPPTMSPKRVIHIAFLSM